MQDGGPGRPLERRRASSGLETAFTEVELMKKGTSGLMLAAMLSAMAVGQGCAATTGPYYAARAPIASHSMLSRFDVLHSQSVGGSPLRMPAPRETGPMYFRF